MTAKELFGASREAAIATVREKHYTHSVPAGKSYWLEFDSALVCWSIPANKNIAKFLLGFDGSCWELARLWAPDGHERNLLTRTISAAVSFIRTKENPDILVSYADPNVGHSGGVYRAASWVYSGRSEEARYYRSPNGTAISRRAFHSGKKSLRKAEILALGYSELRLPGKERFVKPLSRRAKKRCYSALTADTSVEPKPST